MTRLAGLGLNFGSFFFMGGFGCVVCLRTTLNPRASGRSKGYELRADYSTRPKKGPKNIIAEFNHVSETLPQKRLYAATNVIGVGRFRKTKTERLPYHFGCYVMNAILICHTEPLAGL